MNQKTGMQYAWSVTFTSDYNFSSSVFEIINLVLHICTLQM